MACSMLVVLVAVGIVFQFGSQTAMTAVLEASAFVKLPFQTINAYVNPSNGKRHFEEVYIFWEVVI